MGRERQKQTGENGRGRVGGRTDWIPADLTCRCREGGKEGRRERKGPMDVMCSQADGAGMHTTYIVQYSSSS